MNNSDRLTEVLQDPSDVVIFKLAMAEKLKAATSITFANCHIQSLLDAAIGNETSKNIETLTLNIHSAIDDLYPDRVSVERISSFIRDALEEATSGDFEAGNAGGRPSIDDELERLSI